MTFDTIFYDRAECSIEERRKLLSTVDFLEMISNKARREGLLSLEETVQSLDSSVLRTGLKLVVDGTDPIIIQEVLSNLMLGAHLRGKELLEAMVSATGVLAVQSGYHPRYVRLCSEAHLGLLQSEDGRPDSPLTVESVFEALGPEADQSTTS